MTLACLLVALAAFLSPVLFGLAAVVALPLQALGRLLLGGPETALPGVGAQWLPALLEAAEPIYLRVMVLPLAALCAIWVAWWLSSFARQRGAPSLPELYDLEPLAALVETRLWQAVRGASTGDRPRERRDIGGAYQELLSGSLGQLGFRELVFYALDTDSGREVSFALLKDRFLKKLSSNDAGRARRRETIDLAKDGGPLLFDALMAALSPVGLVPTVPIKLPLDTPFGGEVHRFAGSLLSGSSAVQDAVAAGAEQIIYVAGCAPSDRPGGHAIERLIEASMRRTLSDDLAEATRHDDLPVFLIRPDKQRLNLFEVTGRAQIGNERLDLNALIAHGRRDALRLFVEPVLGDDGFRARPELDEGAASGASRALGSRLRDLEKTVTQRRKVQRCEGSNLQRCTMGSVMSSVLDLTFIGLAGLFTVWNVFFSYSLRAISAPHAHRRAHVAAPSAVVLQHVHRHRVFHGEHDGVEPLRFG